jgi:DNA-directed RNA polymerase specialized sigma subunit, sigma24 homolog
MKYDKQLWQAFKQGDRGAYEQIYRQNIRLLYEYAYRFVVDKQFINDCLQDVFVDIWEKRERLSDTDNIKFYLRGSSRVDLQACKLGTGRRFTTS